MQARTLSIVANGETGLSGRESSFGSKWRIVHYARSGQVGIVGGGGGGLSALRDMSVFGTGHARPMFPLLVPGTWEVLCAPARDRRTPSGDAPVPPI